MESDSSAAEVHRWYTNAYHWLDQVGKDKSELIVDEDGARENPGFVKVLRFLSDKINDGDLQVVQRLHTLEIETRVVRRHHAGASTELLQQRERMSSFKDMARMMLAYGEYTEASPDAVVAP